MKASKSGSLSLAGKTLVCGAAWRSMAVSGVVELGASGEIVVAADPVGVVFVVVEVGVVGQSRA